jgi:hypothetical protein
LALKEAAYKDSTRVLQKSHADEKASLIRDHLAEMKKRDEEKDRTAMAHIREIEDMNDRFARDLKELQEKSAAELNEMERKHAELW